MPALLITSAVKYALFILVVTMSWESLHACPTHHLCSQGCSIHPCCNNVLGVAPCLPYLCSEGCAIHPCCNNVLGVAPCLPYSSPLLVVTMSWESLHACLTSADKDALFILVVTMSWESLHACLTHHLFLL